jgi:membrane protease YdiL (CAAX protease family)
LLQFAGLFALGIILSYIVKKTNRLTPSILTHMSFNAVALVGLLLQRSGH